LTLPSAQRGASRAHARIGSAIARVLATLIAVPVLAFASYDAAVFWPRMDEIQSIIDAAAPAERQPPLNLRRALAAAPRDYDSEVARVLLVELKIPSALRSGIGWHATSALWLAGVKLHLSKDERMSLFLTLSYMGHRTFGFADASVRVAGTPLENVSLEQAARLVAYSHSPSASEASEEQLARHTQFLLSRMRAAR
jgi:hypothetical protein